MKIIVKGADYESVAHAAATIFQDTRGLIIDMNTIKLDANGDYCMEMQAETYCISAGAPFSKSVLQ